MSPQSGSRHRHRTCRYSPGTDSVSESPLRFPRGPFRAEIAPCEWPRKTFIILFDLIRIGHRIAGDRFVEGRGRSEVARDRGGITALGVGPGQRFPTQSAERGQRPRRESGDVGGHFHIAQLPHIEFSSPRTGRPTQKDIAGRLHQPLSHHHALAIVSKGIRPGPSFEHRSPCFLGLQEQGIVLITNQQDDETARAHRADTDHLVRRVDDSVAIEEGSAVGRQRAAIPREKREHIALHRALVVLGLKQQRRLSDNARIAVFARNGELVKNVFGRALSGLVHAFPQQLLQLDIARRLLEQIVERDFGVPDFQHAHLGVAAIAAR
jgi:hypothetical protein